MGIYEVKKGDCLSIIAQRKGVSEKEIRKLNPNIPKNGTIIIGQKLVLPDEKITESAGLDSVSLNNTKSSEQVLSKEELKEKKFLDKMNEFVDIPNAKTSVHYDKNFVPYLKISRPKDSTKTEDANFKYGKIKENLKIRNGVLEKSNGGNHGLSVTADVFDIEYGVNRDNLSIAPGHYLYIPLSEIGKKQEVKKGFFVDDYYDSPKNKALKQAVSDFLN